MTSLFCKLKQLVKKKKNCQRKLDLKQNLLFIYKVFFYFFWLSVEMPAVFFVGSVSDLYSEIESEPVLWL